FPGAHCPARGTEGAPRNPERLEWEREGEAHPHPAARGVGRGLGIRRTDPREKGRHDEGEDAKCHHGLQGRRLPYGTEDAKPRPPREGATTGSTTGPTAPPMRIISRHLLRSLAVPFFWGVLALTGLLLL